MVTLIHSSNVQQALAVATKNRLRLNAIFIVLVLGLLAEMGLLGFDLVKHIPLTGVLLAVGITLIVLFGFARWSTAKLLRDVMVVSQLVGKETAQFLSDIEAEIKAEELKLPPYTAHTVVANTAS